MKYFLFILAIFSVNLDPLSCQENRNWQFVYLPGVSYVPPLPLTIVQDDYSDIKLTAKYKTRPLEMPIYYSYRLTTRKGSTGWSIEMNHLKIYLKNTSDDVQDFSVSHGYNHIFINHHWIKDKYTWILGGGIVLGHPESIIRGKYWDEKGGLWNRGYYLAGISTQGAFYFPLVNTKYFVIPLEAKITLGYGHVPIIDGHARVPMISLNLLTGLGLKYIR